MAEQVDDTGRLSAKAKMSTSDKADLASKISDKFTSVMNSVEPEDETTGVIEGTPEKPAEKQPRKFERNDPPDEKEPAIDKEEPSTEAAADDAPTLPAAYVRSLKAAEWSDDEIKSAFKAQGAGFLTFARKVHETRNAEIAKMAELGRQAKTASPVNPTAAAAPAQGALQKLDLDELRKKYGNDELLDVLVGPLNGAIDRVNAMLPQVSVAHERATQTANESLNHTVEQFFAGDELKPFRDAYGTGGNLTDEQLKARTQVIQYADAIAGGAKLQGRSLSIEEALTLAHDATSAKLQKTAARQEIRGELQKRNKGLSVKPSGRGGSQPSGGPAKDRGELEKNVGNKLAALFPRT